MDTAEHVAGTESSRSGTGPTSATGTDAAAPRHLRAGHFVRGVATLGMAQLVTWACSAVMAVLLPHYLGAANLGRYWLAYSVMGLVSLFTNLGTASYVTLETARAPERAPTLYGSALTVRLLLSAIVAAATVVAFRLLPVDPITRTTVDIFCVALLVSAFEASYAALQGFQRMDILALTTTVNAVVAATAAAVLLVHGAGPPGAALAAVLGAAVAQGVCVIGLLRVFRPDMRVRPSRLAGVLAGGLPFFVWGAALTVYSQVDTVLLSVLTSPEVVGWYAAALRVVTVAGFVPTIVVTVAFPALTVSAADLAAFTRMTRQALRVILLVSIPCGIGIALLPVGITTLLRYPATFSHSWLPIQLLAIQIPLVAADMVIGTALSASGRQRQWAVTAIGAAVLNPLANLAAIPLTQHLLGNGAVGASATTTLTEVYMMVVGIKLLRPGVLDRSTLVESLKVVAACLPMAVVAWLLRGFPVMLPVVAGALVYLVTCLLTGLVSRTDLVEVRRQLVRRALRGRAA